MGLIGRSNKVHYSDSSGRQALDQQVVHLNVGQCFSDCFAALKKHPLLFAGASLAALLIGAASGFLLIGSLYAGLLAMFLKAMDGQKPAFRTLFARITQFPRLFFIALFCLATTLIGIGLAILPFVLIDQHPVFLANTKPYLELFHELVTHFLQASWGFRLALFSLATGTFYLLAPRIFWGARGLYMLPLTANRNLPADDAYVTSKKAVQKYGFKQHVLLTWITLEIVFISLELFAGAVQPITGPFGIAIFAMLLQPFLLGLLASAYRQTLRVEADQYRLYENKVTAMRNELQTAHEMQMSLLPSVAPKVEGYEVDDICIPANAVGGDYYTYRWLDNRHFALIAADVSGKAMKAAVTALRFNEMLRYECRHRKNAGQILEGLDAALENQIESFTFITCCIAVLDTQTHTVEIANAGHCEPYLFSHRTLQTRAITLSGFPLGLPRILRSDTEYKTVRIQLEPGDTLLLYSDGVVDAHNEAEEQYEEERLVHLLTRSAIRLGPTAMIERVVQDLERHMGDGRQTDDISLVALKRQGDVDISNQSPERHSQRIAG